MFNVIHVRHILTDYVEDTQKILSIALIILLGHMPKSVDTCIISPPNEQTDFFYTFRALFLSKKFVLIRTPKI